MDRNHVRVFRPQPVAQPCRWVGRTIVEDPKDDVVPRDRAIVPLHPQPTYHRTNPVVRFASAEQVGPVNIESGQIGPGTHGLYDPPSWRNEILAEKDKKFKLHFLTGFLIRRRSPVDGELLIWAFLGFRDLVRMLCHA
jgi:hypothetical protein